MLVLFYCMHTLCSYCCTLCIHYVRSIVMYAVCLWYVRIIVMYAHTLIALLYCMHTHVRIIHHTWLLKKNTIYFSSQKHK
jgi:hypothetical protein